MNAQPITTTLTNPITHRAASLEVMSANNPLKEFAAQTQMRPDTKAHLEEMEWGDAKLLASLLDNQIAYDHAAGRWYVWRGNFWEPDRNGEMRRFITNRLVPEYLRAAGDAFQMNDKKLGESLEKRARELQRKKRIDNVLSLAANVEDLALTGDEWDSNSMTLGVGNGVIDLETGIHGTGAPGDYMRMHAPTDWMGLDYPAPNWEQFILEIFDGEVDIANFIQRLFGYCLTGETTERRLPILYGEGGNGKTVLLQALSYVLGEDLSHTTAADALMDTKRSSQGPQPFVFAMRGKRLVWASESREGQRLNAGLIKQLTGGDSITTRTLNEKPVTFKPSHKVMLLTNHKPHISAEDVAMWDRVLLIPFVLRFVDEPKAPGEWKRKPQLLKSLQEEAPGILAWLVRGCLQWQKEGLNPPASIITATEGYREEEDVIGEFIGECLIVGEGKQALAKELYNSYKNWAKDGGMNEMNMTTFGKRMRRRFGEPAKTNRGMLYSGVGVLGAI